MQQLRTGSEKKSQEKLENILNWMAVKAQSRDLMFVYSQDSYVEILTPNVMVLGGGWWLDQEGGALMMGLVPL